jgi:hypothetical protein
MVRMHLYRQGNRYNYQRRGEYLGYMVRTYYDGLYSWSWTAHRHANIDARDQRFILSEMHRLDEQDERRLK